MEEILGRHNDDRAFARYLASWRDIMTSRIDQATSAFAAIPGVRGLVLAGSNGAGHPWPLSDIDILPIYEDSLIASAVDDVERTRLAILDEWATQGWRTGLDIGRLHFRLGEIEEAVSSSQLSNVLQDDRWYHSIDKGYRSRALYDPDGLAARLASWFTANRFAPEVVTLRLERSAREGRASLHQAQQHLAAGDTAPGLGALLKAIQWRQVWLMEGWGERDNSLGRFGTRFEIAAAAHGMRHVADIFNTHSSLDDDQVRSRLDNAPAWVHERNDRSWRARRATDEAVTVVQNDRDVLRVCTIYELRVASEPPFAEWLGVPGATKLRERIDTLQHLSLHARDPAPSRQE